MLVSTAINGRVLSPKLQRELEDYETLGFDRQHFFMFRKKWYSIKATSNQKGREFSLTFSEYTTLVKLAKIESPHQIGREHQSQYQMSRLKDLGGYTWGNCRFITKAENISEAKMNGIPKRISKASFEFHNKNDSKRLAVASACEKSFVAISPDGLRYYRKNVRKFSEEFGLDKTGVAKMLRGNIQKYKNWTGGYINGL